VWVVHHRRSFSSSGLAFRCQRSRNPVRIGRATQTVAGGFVYSVKAKEREALVTITEQDLPTAGHNGSCCCRPILPDHGERLTECGSARRSCFHRNGHGLLRRSSGETRKFFGLTDPPDCESAEQLSGGSSPESLGGRSNGKSSGWKLG
jgi:hypothetical protein